ncbi:MAG TPA: flagellar basal body L-ring protein FlgH [Devosiaceae bacterium]|jgi:flagellar L-ring protein precursor FlgH|nr:flagellar basal body L-ring protein FlgH [Devosiaceae bacterium]
MTARKIAAALSLLVLLGGCATFDKLENVGEEPKLSAISNPVAQPDYRPVSMPMPAPAQAYYQPNSLFSNEAKGFFKDQRAHKVGDILLVQVTIADKAQIANQTASARSSSNGAGAGGVLGSLFSAATQSGPLAGTDPSKAIDINSSMSNSGTGSVNRSETVDTQVAAVVTQVLGNGNLVIEGHQEVRVNFEIRDLIVAGVVRPEDIGSDNTIPSSKIAEARIAYGGRGQITDVQQPRYGQQVMDAILPF